MKKSILVILIILVFGICFPLSSYALDTIEPFDSGLSDFEFYACFAHAKDNSIGDDGIATDFVFGVGIVDSFSLLAAMSIAFPFNDIGLFEALYAGFIFNTFSTDMLALDIIGGYAWVAPNLIRAHEIDFGIEFNLDLDSLGLYLRSEFVPSAELNEERDYEWLLGGYITPGMFFIVVDALEIFCELSIELFEDSPATFIPGIGLNYGVVDWAEIIFDFTFAVDTDNYYELGICIGTVMGI